MFADAIELVSKYTRPVKFITRNFGSNDVIPGTATLFFVNENGFAVTCKHVAEDLLRCSQINIRYQQFKSELSRVPITASSSNLIATANRYGYNPSVVVQSKSMFLDCADTDGDGLNFSVISHPKYDLSIIRINNAKAYRYTDYAVFAKDSNNLRRGDFLCRYGYPFAEFADFTYDQTSDDIIWLGNEKSGTPAFPIEGMFTRTVVDAEGNVFEYELSTPGLRGQSGGPLFDYRGVVYGMQSETTFLHLGFDLFGAPVRINGEIKAVDNHPFFHVGRCITVDVIKDFLNQNSIKYYVGDPLGEVIAVNEVVESGRTEKI